MQRILWESAPARTRRGTNQGGYNEHVVATFSCHVPDTCYADPSHKDERPQVLKPLNNLPKFAK